MKMHFASKKFYSFIKNKPYFKTIEKHNYNKLVGTDLLLYYIS